MSITLLQATQALDAAIAYALTNQLKESIVVVDTGGHVVASARMDGAFIAGLYGAEGKARGAAMFAANSDALETKEGAGSDVSPPQPTQVRVPTLDGVAKIWAAGRQPIYSQGAVPILVGGVLLGAIGCGGGTGAQDEACAAAGAAAVK